LFDCGYDGDLPFYPSRYFASKGVTRISTLVLSHFDQDHVSNLPALREKVKIESVYRNGTIPSRVIREQKQQSGLLTTAMTSALDIHERWTTPISQPHNYGGVEVRFFYNSYPSFTDMNNLSVVTFLNYEGCGIVVPGDLECAGWEKLLERPDFCECLRKTNFFIASHHGRNEGYSEAVFDYCNPHIILLSDKSIVHESQEHDYAKHARGIPWSNGQIRRVLTTRCDCHIRLTKLPGQPTSVFRNVTL
jgi:beta-lactamase superfamily II metal-dependent hydrolase